MKRLLFLIFFLSAIGYGQYKDVILKYNAADSTVLILPSFVVFNVPTLDTRLDSLIAALNAVESAADTRIDSILANSLPDLDTRIDSILTPLAAVEDSILNKYTKSDTRIVIADSVAFARDSIAIHRTELNAQMDSLKNKYTKSDTRAVIYDSVAVQRDSVGIHRIELDALMDSVKSHYSQAIIDILLDLKLDITDSSYLVPYTYLTAALAYYSPLAGSSSITTLGTIGTGSWNATAIDTAKLNGVSYLWAGYGMTLSARGKGFQLDIDTTDDIASKEYVTNTLGSYSLTTHNHSGTYQAADGDLDTYAGITPSADMQILLTYSVSQILTYLAVPTTTVMADSLQDMREALALKANIADMFKTNFDNLNELGENNILYLNATGDTVKLREATAAVVTNYDGEFNDLDVTDTVAISGSHSYDSYLVTPYATGIGDTLTQALNVYPWVDSVFVMRKYPQLGEGNKYSLQRKTGNLAEVTSVNATASTATSMTITWTNPATSTSATARPIDSVIICYSLAGGYATVTEYGDSIKTVGLTGSDSLTSLAAGSYAIKMFSKTYADETIAGGVDMCSLEGAGTPAMLVDLRAWYSFDESSGDAVDSSGRGNTLTNANNCPYQTGVIGNSVRTDSLTYAYLLGAQSEDTNWGDSTTTMCVWIKNGCVSTYNYEDYVGVYGEMRLYRNYADLRFRLMITGGATAGDVTVSADFADTLSYHFVVCKFRADDDSLFISVDGGAWTRGVCSSSPIAYEIGSGYGMALGRYSSTLRGSAEFDNLGIWRRELTDDEIAWLYNSGAGRSYLELNE